MDSGQVLRLVRQRQGWSQRDLAEVVARAPSTVARWESGASPLPLQDLDGLLAGVGLDLALVPRLPEPAPELVAHLRLSTSERLWLACGGEFTPAHHRRPPLWRALQAVASRGHVVLEHPDALVVWLAGRRLMSPLGVRVQWSSYHRSRVHEVLQEHEESLQVREERELPLGGLVRVGLDEIWAVHVATPTALALDPACQEHAPHLRQAALLLDRDRGSDDAGRRSPAHRVPDEVKEAWDLMHRPEYGPSPGPYPVDSRGWRLHAPVSLSQWLHERGQPRRPDGRVRRGHQPPVSGGW